MHRFAPFSESEFHRQTSRSISSRQRSGSCSGMRAHKRGRNAEQRQTWFTPCFALRTVARSALIRHCHRLGSRQGTEGCQKSADARIATSLTLWACFRLKFSLPSGICPVSEFTRLSTVRFQSNQGKCPCRYWRGLAYRCIPLLSHRVMRNATRSDIPGNPRIILPVVSLQHPSHSRLRFGIGPACFASIRKLRHRTLDSVVSDILGSLSLPRNGPVISPLSAAQRTKCSGVAFRLPVGVSYTSGDRNHYTQKPYRISGSVVLWLFGRSGYR